QGRVAVRFLALACAALRRLVLALERVLRVPVLRHRVGRGPPVVHHVTGGAVHDAAGERRGSGVRVVVTVGAIREVWTGHHFARGEVMTLLARDSSVAPTQRIL